MKKILLLIFLNFLFVFGQKPEFSELVLPPKQIVRIDYPLLKAFKIKVYNKSKFFLGISLLSRDKDSLHENFSLEKGKFRSLIVRDDQYLQFENRYLASLKVVFTLEKDNQTPNKLQKNLTPQRAFYLENNTSQKIPLQIPGVMSSNLNPFSRSGMDLKNGQKIFLSLGKKKVLILTITDTIAHGSRIDVARLINEALNKLED
uniref:Uncharacterized protein n=1 Tax=uncultured Flavobacteriia bacterium TaxID=212695 RepID=F4MN11_9BACT|nr:hypothetical protein [uncultured bacterium]CBL87524.1 hypothetical protein S18_873_0018 [uncultured Flavobacteriia bacterium]|tara:strand:+ start:286 stop:894 length:609 start_codon:yes stop_codon:yes gene_type:complete